MQRTLQQGMITTSTAVSTTTRGDVAAVIYEEVSNVRGDAAAVTYEEVTSLGGNKPRLQIVISDTPIASH